VSPDRVTVWALFDAHTAERISAEAAWADGSANALELIPAAEVTVWPRARRSPGHTPTATPWPTLTRPPPTPVPDDARLTWSNMPPALAPTFRAIPLAPGTSWTWRVTLSNFDVRWAAEIVSETIEAVWPEGDLAVVRSRVEVEPLTPPRNRIYHVLRYAAGENLRYVAPGVIAASREDVAEAQEWARDVPPSHPPPDAVAEVAVDWFSGLLPGASDVAFTSVRDGTASVTTPAGTFNGCWAIDHIGGASWGASRRVCPGVGTVQYSYGDCAISHCCMVVAELIDWHRAELPER